VKELLSGEHSVNVCAPRINLSAYHVAIAQHVAFERLSRAEIRQRKIRVKF